MKYELNRYIIVCESRTGSTMLSTALQTHNEVCAHGEVLQPRQLNEKTQDDKLEFYGLNYIDSLATNMRDYLRKKLIKSPLDYVKEFVFYQGRFKSVGFKFKYEELSDPVFKEVVDYVAGETDIKIIHLHRKNLWERYRSGFITRYITKQYNSTDKQLVVDTNKKFELDIKEIQKNFDQTNEWVNYYSKLFSSHEVINFTYEEFNDNAQRCFDSVCDFLKISKFEWKPRTKKIQQMSDDDLFENMNEVREYFAKTKYSKFFK